MRLVLAPKVAVVEEDAMVAEEDEGGGVVSSHRGTTHRIQSYNISPNNLIHRTSDPRAHWGLVAFGEGFVVSHVPCSFERRV